MKKIIVVLIIVMIPITVLAEPVGTRSATVEEIRETITEKISEAQVIKDEVKIFIIENKEIKNQTKEQILEMKEEMIAAKEELREQFEGLGELSAEEKNVLRGEVSDLRTQIKEVHAAALYLRKELTPEITNQIRDIRVKLELTEEEEGMVEGILNDIKSL